MERTRVQFSIEDIYAGEDPLTQHYCVMKETGDCYAAMAEFEQAEHYYAQAAALAPHRPDAHVGIGVVLLGAGRIDDSLRAFAEACRLDPHCAEAYNGMAMAYQQKEDYPPAQEMYLKCLELDVDNLTALLGLFQTCCQMGTFATITHYLELYLEKHPGDLAVLFCLATLYARDGRLLEAKEAVLNVLALQADKTEALDLLDELDRSLASAPEAVSL